MKVLLVRRAMKNHLPLTQWRFIGLFKMRRRLARSANDPTRSVGSTAETVDTALRRPSTASKKTNIVPSVPISAYVQKRTARYVWKNRVPPTNVWRRHGLLRMLFERETFSYNPIKRSSLTASYAIISIRRHPMDTVHEQDRVCIARINVCVRTKSVHYVFRNPLPRIPRCCVGVRPTP